MYFCMVPCFFRTIFCTKNVLLHNQQFTKNIFSYVRDSSIFEVPIVFFSAFERVNLTPDKPMQRLLDIQQLYEPGPWPSLDPIMHVGLLRHVLGRAPLVPLFLQGNSTATIPHGMRNLRSRFPNGRADTQPDKGDGSRIYEVNNWLGEFGRGMPRRMSVAATERLRSAMRVDARAKAWATRKRNREMRDGH
mgnify:CR=1 FL=1